MKKNHIACLYIICLCLYTIVSFYLPEMERAQASGETVVIPQEAIRLRILANSDKEEDQAVKREIRDEVNAGITEWVKDLTSLKEARNVIQSKLPEMQRIAEKLVEEKGLSQPVKIEFGQAQFPTKLYGQFLYPAGEYEAIVITLGAGEGANWWCVLFPPLCFLDFSNGTAVSQTPYEDEEQEVKEELQMSSSEGNEEPETDLETRPEEAASEEMVQPVADSEESAQEVVEDTALLSTPAVVPDIAEQEAGPEPGNEEREQLFIAEDDGTQVMEKRSFFADLLKNMVGD
ncbi:MAG: stage II sporulation protein R [Bacillus sp. (in: firmicutes)]